MNCVSPKSSDRKKPINHRSDVNNDDCHWKIWPIVRNNYQRIAYEAYKSNDNDKAILYDSMALSCGFVGGILNVDRLGQNIDHQTVFKTVDWQQNTNTNQLINFLSAAMGNVSIKESVSVTSNIDSDSDQRRFNELCAKCAELPQEWNVVQLSQMYNGYNSYSTIKDSYTSDAPIKITLFRDSLSESRNNRPTFIVLDLCETGEKSIFSTAYEIHHVLYKNYTQNMEATYKTFIQQLTQLQTKLVDDMSSWLGPWISLLCGKIKGRNGKAFEQSIFKQVDQFCNEHNDITENQRVLLHLMCRRIDLFDIKQMKQGCSDIANTNEQYNHMVTFLKKLKEKAVIKSESHEYYPCILVVDEKLDQMPWEMVLTSQQYTRVHSIHLLFDLYERFKDQIDDGYLKIKVKNGFALVNPDNDLKLADMRNRLSQYYDTYFPKWNLIDGVVPTLKQISDGLGKTDLFVYSGHGSSLQFFSSMEFEQIKHNCVMMLFGCESIAMKPHGIICEASCSAYTYFHSGCPAVLGGITIVTDIWIDLITILLLTQWTPSKHGKHPTIQTCKDESTKKRVNQILKKYDGKRNPNLLELLCNIRNEREINIRMRSAIVLRGLPPFNTVCDK
ncbi:uncharacterized protein LOC129578113 [Sitodiplosis mosellana]|uniref:uncharacterized protein LOC129578113 n=1 Tax=Sitodiplosis mosellana TaxID=263140 RepID=UPI0024449AD5|nr:uncharacterized protein LOC129578113 [Sitodiplosis mosellana]